MNKALKNKKLQDAVTPLLQTVDATLYISLFFGAGAKVVAASLGVQFLIGIRASMAHFQKGGERIEGTSRLLMAFIRGHQAIRKCQEICIQEEVRKSKEKGTPYLPLVNRAQRLLINAAYFANGGARWALSEILRTRSIATAALVAIPGLASFALSAPLYFLASYAGIGRFERIEPTSPSPDSAAPLDRIRVICQNLCGQNPWSRLTSGLRPPLEIGPDGTRRVDAFIKNVVTANPDVVCYQEVDDLDTSRLLAEKLAENGYFSVWDLGCDPIFNHSGLFVAVRNQAAADSISFTSIKPEHLCGITAWCMRGIFTVDMPMTGGGVLRILNIHLSSGGAPAQPFRLQQFENYIARLIDGFTSLVLGDSNFETARLSPEERQTPGLAGLTNATEGQMTYLDQDGSRESIDVALCDPTALRISNLVVSPPGEISDHSLISLTAEPVLY